MGFVRKKLVADKRVRMSSEVECRILKLANAEKFSQAMYTLIKVIELAETVKEAQQKGSQLYLIDEDGGKTKIKF